MTTTCREPTLGGVGGVCTDLDAVLEGIRDVYRQIRASITNKVQILLLRHIPECGVFVQAFKEGKGQMSGFARRMGWKIKYDLHLQTNLYQF